MQQTKKITIATRKSRLALWQAEHVKTQLNKHYPSLEIVLLPMQTQGDRILEHPLSKFGGKGLFIKELETALYEHRADIAVHSMKDVSIEPPKGLTIAIILKRENPQDVLLSNNYSSLNDLPEGAIIGTSSLRRQCQIKAWRKDLAIKTLRGNIDTRLEKLHAKKYDAIILAAAGIIRLGLQKHIQEFIATETLLPAIGQGAIGIQTRQDDSELLKKLQPLNHTTTQKQITAERIISQRLSAGCQAPIAAYAEISEQTIQLRSMVGNTDGSIILRDKISGELKHSEQLSMQLAENLLQKGADKILAEHAHI